MIHKSKPSLEKHKGIHHLRALDEEQERTEKDTAARLEEEEPEDVNEP